MAAELSYAAEQVRQQDHERFLTALFAPAERREALFALYAFNLEVAKTAEVVSEPMLGQIRLQWWRETLDGIYEKRPRRHEVVEPLADAVVRWDLSREHFERLLDARENDLDAEPPATMAELEAYADATAGGLGLLALEALGGEALAATGRLVGTAWGLTGLVRAIPFHARQKRLYVPTELLKRHGVVRRDLFELRPSTALSAAAAEIAGRAGTLLAEARALRPRPPRPVLAALLPAVLARRHLGRLARAGYDPFDAQVQAAAPDAAWRLTLAYLRGRI